MNWVTVFIGHFFLVSVIFALPASKEVKKPSTSAPEVLTTENVSQHKGSNNHEELPVLPKLAAKKRDIPEALVDRPEDTDESVENFNDGKSSDEYAKVLALGPALDNARIENAILKAESYGDPASMNEYRYYGNEERRKRTAVFNGLLNSPAPRPKRELELTPDEVLGLLALWEQQRLYNNLPSNSRWNEDDTSLEMTDNDIEDENDRVIDNGYGSIYDRRLPVWGNFAKDKRFMVSRRRRSSFLGNPKLRAPVLRRAIL